MALTITGILTAGYAFITAHELLSYFKKKKSPTKPDADVEQQLVVPEIKVEDHSALSPTGSEDVIPSFPSPSLALTPLTSRTRSVASSQGQEDEDSPDRTRNRRIHLRDPRKPKRQRRQEWSPDLDPMLLGITIFQIIVFVYFVTMTELLLKRNPAADSSQDSDWGFGQVSKHQPCALPCVIPHITSTDSWFSICCSFTNYSDPHSPHGRPDVLDDLNIDISPYRRGSFPYLRNQGIPGTRHQ